MRNDFRALVVVSLVAVTLFSATAFDAASSGARNVTAKVVGDSSAYLALEKNAGSLQRCFVKEGTAGDLIIQFGDINVHDDDCPSDGGGIGINPDSVYYFDDLINVTNKGTDSIILHVNTTGSVGDVLACVKTATGTMSNGCYGVKSIPQNMTVGQKVFVGVYVDATGLTAGQTVTGTITFEAARQA